MSISGVCAAALDMLKAQLPPLIAPGQIGFCSPADVGDSFLLGLNTLHIVRDNRYRMAGRVRLDSSVSQPAPFCAELTLMVTSYAGKKSGPLDDYKLLERVLQLWHDNEIPFTSVLQPALVPLPRLEVLTPDPDTVSKLWQFPGVPYRTSLFFRVAPVAISSTLQITAERVGDVGYQSGSKEEKQ